MSELRSLSIFAEAATAGSFVSATRALDVAPAVVTRAAADLERHLGARLISRTTRRLSLMNIGERYLGQVFYPMVIRARAGQTGVERPAMVQISNPAQRRSS
jgi:regulatory helix-turn-helix LysR family protein